MAGRERVRVERERERAGAAFSVQNKIMSQAN